jgi:hypothetical protein
MDQICFNCDGLIENPASHNCIKGITDNINRLHSTMNQLLIKKLDHLDGLKHALTVIDKVEYHYKEMGINYHENDHDPFYDIRNKIRMLLGLRLIAR